MSIQPIKQISGTAVHVPGADVDTDRIIPARFLKCVTFDDLAEGLFYDVRYDEAGQLVGHPLDDSRFEGASIMLVGANFGCGSSREHAPQSIYRSGFRAMIGVSFAEIFFGNSTGLGMPCVCAAAEDIEKIAIAVEADPGIECCVDLESMKVTFGDEAIPVTMPESAREALLSARWDPIGELLDNSGRIEDRAAALPYV